MCVVSYYELGLRAAVEKALILSRDLAPSNQGADGILVESVWKCIGDHILILPM